MSTQPDLEALAKIETSEQFLAAARANEPGTSIAHLWKYTPYAERRRAERREIERLVIPHTKARLSVIPYYRERLNDIALWRALIWQPVVSTMELYAKLAAEERAAKEAGLPWSPEY